MDILYANVLNELEKIFLKKRNIIFLIITILGTAAGSLGIILFQNEFGVTVASGSAFPIFALGFFVKTFLPLFVFMVGIDMFAGEAGERTLKLTLTKPISRNKIFISKNIALVIYAVINLMVVLLISFAAGLFFSIKGDILSGFFMSFRACYVDVVPIIVLALLTSFISQMFKGSSGALVTCIIIYLGLYILSMVFPVVDRLSITSLLDWHLLWEGSSVATGAILNDLVQMLAYSLIFFSLGRFMFDGKEV